MKWIVNLFFPRVFSLLPPTRERLPRALGMAAAVRVPASPRRRLHPARWAHLLALVIFPALGCLGARTSHAFAFSESFEAPGYDNTGWVVPPNSPATPDPDFASPALAASQSLHFAAGGFVQRPFNQTDSFFFYFRARWNTWEDQCNVIDWLDASPSLVASVFAGNGHTLSIIHGGVEVAGTTVIQTGVTYHVWVDWTRGTGNDGTMKLYISTTGIQPALPEASLTTGAGGAIALMDVGPFLHLNTDVIFDNIIADSLPIGDSPDANAPPTISSIASQTTQLNTVLGPIPFTVGDAETPAADLVVTGTSSNPAVVPDLNIVLGGNTADRTVTLTPASNVSGVTTITLRVNDGQNTVSTTFTVTVGDPNSPPTISSIPNQTTAPNTTLGPIGFTVGDVETPVADLVVTGTSSNPDVVPDFNIVLSGDTADRSVTLTPVANASGVTTITLRVTDGQASATTSFNLTVTTPNSPPTISSIANQATPQNTALGPIGFTVGDAETPAAELGVTATSSNQDVVPNANIVLSGETADRSVILTPVADVSGVATITLEVSDGQSAATTSFTVTVGNPNSPPTISTIANQSTPQGVALGPISFSVGDAETAAAALVVGGSSSNPDLLPSSNIVLGGTTAARTVTLTPLPGQTGIATITLTVSDGQLVASTTFDLVVSPPDTSIYLFSEGFEGVGYENPGWIETGTPNPDFASPALLNQHSLHCANGSFVQRPFVFSDSFNLYLRVRWNVIAYDQPILTCYDADTVLSAQISMADVDPIQSSRLSIQHGTAAAQTTEAVDENATYHLWLEWTKGTGADGTLKLFVSSTGVKPAAPAAEIANGNGPAPAFIVLGWPGLDPDVIFDTLLVDDEPIGSNPDANRPPTLTSIANQTTPEDTATGALAFEVGDLETPVTSLTVTGFSSDPLLVTDARIVLAGSGASRTVSVSPEPNQVGVVTISLVVNDGTRSATNSFELTITPVNDAPVVANPIPAQAGAYGSPFSYAFPQDTFADVDILIEGDSLSYVATGLPSGVSFTPDTRSFAGTPTEAGVFTVTVVANDGGDPSLTATNLFPITIAPRAITVTAVPDTKLYDGSVASAGVPSVSPAVLPPDTASFTQNFANGEAGIGKLLVPSGVVNDGHAGGNYAITFVNDATGVITPRPLTVTAADRSRVYGAGNPSFDGTVEGVQGADGITASYSTPATALSPAGSYPIIPAVVDPNGKLANYSVSLVNGVLAITTSPTPQLSVVSRSNTGEVTLLIGGEVDQHLVLEFSEDLVQWTVLAPVHLSAAPLSFVDSTAGGAPHRFYRVLLP